MPHPASEPCVMTSLKIKAPIWSWLLRLGIGLLVVTFLMMRARPEQFLDVLKKVSPVVPLTAVCFYWLTQALSAAKWRLLLQARGADFSFTQCARIYLLGMFCNLFLPTTIGGDGVRAMVAGPRCGGTTVAASSILVERLTGLAALLTIGAIGVALWGAHSSLNHVLPRIFAVLALAVSGFLALRFTAYRLERTIEGKGRTAVQKWARLHREMDFYASSQRRSTLVLAIALSLLMQAAQIGINIYLARAAGLQVPVITFFWLVPLLSLMSMIPIGIGGLGVREAAAMAVLGNQESGGAILAWSLLFQATVWLSSLPGALLLGEWRRSR